MQPTFRYLDCLDTVRNELEDAARIRNGGELMFRILSGETVRLSQTQAFDSGQILTCAARPGFRELIASGAIQIVMRNDGANPLAAFLSGLNNDEFHLSAWPEIENPGIQPAHGNEVLPRADAKQVFAEAIEHGGSPSGLPASLHQRWKSLVALNHACLESSRRGHPSPLAGAAAIGLRTQLESAKAKSHQFGYLRDPFTTMLDSVSGEARSAYHRFIHRDLDADAATKATLHSVVNMLYNRVVASSLASRADLTTPFYDAREVVSAIQPEHAEGSIEIETESPHKLEGLTWDTLVELRSIQQDDALTVEAKARQITERSILAVEELAAPIEAWSFHILPVSAAVGVEAAVGAGLGFLFERFMPGSSPFFIEAVGAALNEFGLKPVERIRRKMEERWKHERQRELIAIQLDALPAAAKSDP